MNKSLLIIILYFVGALLLIVGLIASNILIFNTGVGLLLLLLTISLAKLFR